MIKKLRYHTLAFYAPLHIQDGDLERLERELKLLSHIGLRTQGITGEVRCRVCEMHQGRGNPLPYPRELNYTSLEYSVVLLAPASIYAPYGDGVKTYTYIPGAEVRKSLLAWQTDGFLKEALPKMRFSNAYIAEKGVRLLPVPMCMSVVKLDREQLRYRLAPGKDPKLTEQDVSLNGAFSTGFTDHYMPYVRPVTERITSSDGRLYDALSGGQVFRGTIYGTSEQLRRTEAWLRSTPFLSFGSLREEGFGQAYLVPEALKEATLQTETLSVCFDVGCMSHTLLYNKQGMTGTRPEGFLEELEWVTGRCGAFAIVGCYTNICMDYANRFGWTGDGPVTRCLKMGSVLRLRTKDGKAVDIFAILHTFIGESTRDGYGEIMAWPAADVYYRVTKKLMPRKYDIVIETRVRELHLGARWVHAELTELLKRQATALGLLDSADPEERAQAQISSELLEELRDAYDPEIEMKVLEDCYREGLRENAGNRGAADAWDND